jgi:hypothetical protein
LRLDPDTRRARDAFATFAVALLDDSIRRAGAAALNWRCSQVKA